MYQKQTAHKQSVGWEFVRGGAARIDAEATSFATAVKSLARALI